MKRRSPLPPLLLATLGAWGLPGCGDALLPSDFSGPPAAAVHGDVVGAEGQPRDAARPRLALEWLVGFSSDSPALLQQPLAFERSPRLQHDLRIDLRLPDEGARFATSASLEEASGLRAAAGPRLAVAKIIYFDDRVPDDRLDRGCRAELAPAPCDEVKAVSAHYVVFLEEPLYCPRGEELRGRVRLAAGYHYFAFEGGVLREIGPEEALHFDVGDRTLAEGDPTMALADFTHALLRALGRALQDGC
jgi:hypothetical protein